MIKHFPGELKDRWNVDLGGGFELDAGTSTIDFQGINGYLQHFGTDDITYHRIVFSNDIGSLESFNSGANCTIDILEFKHGGYFLDDFTINTLILSPGYTYLLEENTTQTIGQIVAPGNCNALITIRSDATGNAAFIDAPNDQTDLQYLTLRDVHNIGIGILAAQNSIDLGNNPGWAINELGNRTLYWVGGAGDWGDPAHWSLSSGGLGGQCVPTLRDDVIFDLNSFTAQGQEVTGQLLNGYYCHNITWEENLPDPVFNLNRLYCHGSAIFSPDMTNQLSYFHLSGSGAQTVLHNGQAFQNVYVDGDGSYTFLDELEAFQFLLRSGTLNTNDQMLTLGRLEMENENTAFQLNLGSSRIIIIEPTTVGFIESYSLTAPYGANTTIDPGNSLILLTHPNAGAYLSGGLQFHNVIFSGTEGLLNICHRENSSNINNPAYFNLLEVGGDAIIKGYHNTDTLLFAPGKSYRLEYNVTQTVNEYFFILGNNCNPIELFSTLPGEKATIRMASGTVNGDFIQMQDQIATGGVDFFAGTHSTDIGNSNQGWVFDSNPDYVDVGFFGADRSICEGESLSLSAYNYSPGETYEWSTGSTDESILISDADTYWARVTFGNMCEIIDTINVSTIEPVAVELGPDTSFCDGESLLLDATSTIPDVSYTWQDGTDDPTFLVTTQGNYFVELDNQGCTTADTIAIAIIAAPMVDLGGNQSLCEGASLTLNATAGTTASYLWQDGSVDPILVVDQSGNYSVMVTENGCTGQDQVTITFNPIPVFSLGPDTSLCSGETLSLDFSGIGDSYSWQDDSTNPTFNIEQSGQLWLIITNNGCQFTDTLEVDFFQTPSVDLGSNQDLCEGESITLDATAGPTATYTWQDGSAGPTLNVNQSGNYSVMVTENGCTGQDQLTITFNPIPVFSLGPDTSLCSGESLFLDFSSIGDTYFWQNGHTGANFSIQQEGQYWLEIGNNGCWSADTLEVFLQPSPEVTLGNDRTICEGEETILEATISNYDQFSWFDGTNAVTYIADQMGTYWLEATLGNCSSRDSLTVHFQAPIQTGLPDSLLLCRGEKLTLSLDVPPSSIVSWQDGSNATEYEVDEAGIYFLTIDDGACLSFDTISVSSSSCGKIKVYVPNAFSPNRDGINDIFFPSPDPQYTVVDYQLMIFDRWGSLVHSSQDQKEGWDGLIEGKAANFGVYVYLIQYSFEDQGEVFEQTVSGDITLLR